MKSLCLDFDFNSNDLRFHFSLLILIQSYTLFIYLFLALVCINAALPSAFTVRAIITSIITFTTITVNTTFIIRL